MTSSEWEVSYLNNLRAHADGTRRLLSNAERSKRERGVCAAFLRCLGHSFAAKEIQISTKEPVDVNFGLARFQVTEITSLSAQPRRRGDEWNVRQTRYRHATNVDDALEPYVSSQAMPLSMLQAPLATRISAKGALYSQSDQLGLDLLIYIDIPDVFLEARSEVCDFSELGTRAWRSVSLLWLPYSIVLCAQENAPAFLRTRAGTKSRNWTQPDGFFDL